MRFAALVLLFMLGLQYTSNAQNKTIEQVVIGDSTLSVTDGEIELTGRIIYAESDEPISGVSVYTNEIKSGTVSDSTGRYVFKLPPGKYEIRFQFLGMETVIKDAIIYSSGTLDIAMREVPLDLQEVIIESSQAEDNVLSAIPGVENISISEIEELPAFLGEVDVVNSLISLPGVNTVGEGSLGFNVRGGRVDQNLVLMDGAQLFNSSHVLGLFSVFNPDVTKNFTLYKGHIPPRYGGRLSSVLDVNMRNGSLEEYKVDGGLGIAATRLLVEGPVKNNKTSFLLAGRSSYSDWLLGLVKNTDIQESSAFYFDGNARLTHRFTENSKINVSLYGSHDYFRFSDQFGYSWDNTFANLQWNYQISEKIFSEFSAAYGIYSPTSFMPSGNEAFELDNGIDYYKFKQDFLFIASEKHTLNAGIEWNNYDLRPEKIAPRNSSSAVSREEVEKGQAREASFYLSDDINLLPGILVSLGARYTLYSKYGPSRVLSYQPDVPKSIQTITDTTFYSDRDIVKSYSGFEPRISARLSLSNSSSIKLSYNRTRQYVHLISNTTSPTPADIWQLSDRHITAKSSNNYSVGYFKNFASDSWETSAEFFYRDIENLVEYKDFAELFINDNLETELLVGNGEAYGGEFSVKKTAGNWTGWLSYAYTRSFVKVDGATPQASINQGDRFPSNYDQPHNIDLAVKRRLGERSAFSFNFTYRTGRPITALTSTYTNGPTSIPTYSERNAYRIPDYIRLDVSFTIAENIWKGRTVDPNRKYKDSMTISFYNLLSRDNAFSVFYKRPQDAASAIPRPHKLSVLGAIVPSVTYNFSF
jgi:hypothetical protein